MAKITIPLVTPSLNALLRMHYHDRSKLKLSYVAHIKGAVHDMNMKINRLTKPKKRILKIYSFRRKELDRDNLYGSHKPLVDAIKDLGMIWDDSEKYCDLRIFQLPHPEQKTEIFIDEI